MNKTKKLQNLSISLEALDLNHKDYIIYCTSKELQDIRKESEDRYNNCLNSMNLNTVVLISIIHRLLIISNAKSTIRTIVSDYFSKNQQCNEKFSAVTSQYLHRFIYKYQIYYKHKYCGHIKNFRLKKNKCKILQ